MVLGGTQMGKGTHAQLCCLLLHPRNRERAHRVLVLSPWPTERGRQLTSSHPFPGALGPSLYPQKSTGL